MVSKTSNFGDNEKRFYNQKTHLSASKLSMPDLALAASIRSKLYL